MKIINALIHSNIYISLAAVFLTVETQIQLGMEPQWHPYLFIIFFATLFEYNFHRFITVVTNKEALESEKHQWVKNNLKGFYLLVLFSVLGFMGVVFLARIKVLITLAPLALVTLLYSLPVFENKRMLFRLREIPYLKIFLIAFVWASATIFLPIIQSNDTYELGHITMMLIERSLFIFAITIPFDIRDKEADRQAGLKTIPLLINEDFSLRISYLALFSFAVISIFHYAMLNKWNLVVPLFISATTTYLFLKSNKVKNLPQYHYGILDGTMLLQGLLVLAFYYLPINGQY